MVAYYDYILLIVVIILLLIIITYYLTREPAVAYKSPTSDNPDIDIPSYL